MIPQAAPMLRFARYAAAVDGAIRDVLNGEALIIGPNVAAFEAAFARYVAAQYCVGVNSGTDALALALRATGVGPGREVITVALTAPATAHAILHCGATPCFVDVDPHTWVMDPDSVEAAINPRTAAILAVHLYGLPAPVDVLREIADRHGLVLIEDCAQAHGTLLNGRPVGTFGHAAGFSFYPTKNLGALGDAGAVVTNDPEIADRVRALRTYAWSSAARISTTIGYNSRLDEIQAAVLLAMLTYLETGNAERRRGADNYRTAFSGLALGLPADLPGAVYHQFAVRVADRDAVAARLRDEHSLLTAVHYTPPLHQHPAFSLAPRGSLATTETLVSELLSLPIQPEIIASHFSQIVDAVSAVMTRG